MGRKISLFTVLILCAACWRVTFAADEVVDLTILHFNDFHARFDPVAIHGSGTCKQPQESCIGGFARMFSMITKYKKEDNNILVFNAGDVSTGSLWFEMFLTNVTSHFLNLLPVDAMTLGNHEFDEGVDEVIRYLNKARAPAIMTNVDATEEPDLEPLLLKSFIIYRKNKAIGVVGYVADYRTMASTGSLKFLDIVKSIASEAAALRQKGVHMIIGLSHVGFDADKDMAKRLDVDIIIGAHSHTFLYTGNPPPNYDVPVSNYPTVVTQNSGRKVLVVQAGAYSRYIGVLKVTMKKVGSTFTVDSWSGNPVQLNNEVKTDPKIEDELLPWRTVVERLGSRKVGETLTMIDRSQGICYVQECNMGRFFTDALVHEYVKQRDGRSWTKAAVAITNPGNARASISPGAITFADFTTSFPFKDYFGLVELNGQHLIELLEFSIATPKSPFFQSTGIKAKFDLTKPAGQRVSDVYVRCAKCAMPVYEAVRLYKYYPIVVPEYLYNGGEGLTLLKKHARYWSKGRMGRDIVLDYLKEKSPVWPEIDGSITVKATQEMLRLMKHYRKRLL